MATNDAILNDPSHASRLPPLTYAPALRLSTDDLESIILDYLTTSTYLDTARAFVRQLESSTDASSELPESDHGPIASTSAVHAGVSTTEHDSNDSIDVMHDGANDDDGDDDIADTTLREINGHDHRESAMLPHEHVRLIRLRRGECCGLKLYVFLTFSSPDICDTIRRGAIQAAIDQCNLHFPTVLATPAAGTAGAYSKTHAPVQSVSQSAAGNYTSRPIKGLPSHSSKSPHLATFSTDPVRLAIALQLQLFIEIVRQSAALHASASHSNMAISRPGTPFSAAQSPISVNGSLDGSTASLASTASSSMSHSSGTSATGSTSALSVALSHAQTLYAQIDRLPDPAIRQAHRLELESVSGLLPYHDPFQSPVSFYLDEKRRDALAEAVNGAVLCA